MKKIIAYVNSIKNATKWSAGRVYTIKDEYGQGSGKITIQPTGGELVDGKVNYIISVPNQSVSLVSRANKWWII